MTNWVDQYIYLIFLVYGLAFFVLGVIAFVIPRESKNLTLSPFFGYLALFGFLHGCQEFIDQLRLIDETSVPLLVRQLFMFFSFIALFEFGRLGWNREFPKYAINPILAYTIASVGILVLIGSSQDNYIGVDAGARMLMGVPGAFLGGIAIYATRDSGDLFLRRWQMAAAFALGCYGCLTAFIPPGEENLGWLLTTSQFAAWFGIPIQIPRALCAIVVAVAFILIFRKTGSIKEQNLLRVASTLDGFIYRAEASQKRYLDFFTDGLYPLLDMGKATVDSEAKLALNNFVHPDDQELLWQTITSCPQGSSFEISYRLLLGNNQERWVYEKGYCLFDDAGNLRYVEGRILDDTTRRKMVLDLEQQQARLQEMQNIAHIGSWEFSLSDNSYYWSDEMYSLLGYEKGKVIPSAELMLFRVEPSDQKKVITAHQKIQEDCKPQVVLYQINPSLGEPRYVREYLTCRVNNDGSNHIVATVQDVTLDYTQTAELNRLATIVTNASDFIGISDINGIPLFLNEAGRKMVGIQSDKELFDNTVPDFFPADLQPKVLNEILPTVVNDGRWVGEIDFQHFHNNSRIPVLFNIFRIDDPITGEPINFATVTKNVAEQKQAELELKQYRDNLEETVEQRTLQLVKARDDAEQANRSKSEFLSHMSHELRTPLNAIIGFSDLTLQDEEHKLNETQRDNLQEIRNAGSHLLSLVNKVLDLSRIEKGKLELDITNVSVHEVIEECLLQVTPITQQANLSVKSMIPKNVTVKADALRLKQIILNLLSNAIKYNKQSGSIEIFSASSSPDTYRICIKDTGVGIEAIDLTRIFSPFERLVSVNDGIEGSGVGLSLCKEFIIGMDGDIGVESQPGIGSTFWIELPIVIRDTENKPVATNNEKIQVLYVEDNPANVKLVAKVFEGELDVDLVVAETGSEGLHKLNSQQVNLILLDINLPDMNGFQFMEQLNNSQNLRNIPVIAVTANAMKEQIERGKQLGFRSYLTKPIDINQLTGTVREHIPVDKSAGKQKH